MLTAQCAHARHWAGDGDWAAHDWRVPEHACGLPGALLFFLGLAHFLGDLSPQAFVPCKAKNVVHLVLFAPSHQFLTAEPGVRSQDDLRMRPGFPNLRDDALQFFYAPGARIDVRRP